jgi:CDP-diglyceride synthetase
MKNKIGIIGGFVVGSIGFLLLFKVTILNYTTPEDELAPGIVVLAAILIGVASAFIGHFIQNYFRRESNY